MSSPIKIHNIDTLATGYTDDQLFGLSRMVDRGYAKFWAKRGGDPDGGTWKDKARIRYGRKEDME
jgi:hypothetical protein